jgi:hypothetical protein
MSQHAIEDLINYHQAGRVDAVLTLCRDMDARGELHPLQAIMMAEAAAELNQPIHLNRALDVIGFIRDRDQVAGDIMRDFLRQMIIPKVLTAFNSGRYELVLRYLESARILDPVLAEIFPDSVPSLLAQAQITPFELPQDTHTDPPAFSKLQLGSSAAPQPNRRALILARQNYFGPGSRPHEFSARFQLGLTKAGWITQTLDPTLDGSTPIAPNGGDLFDRVAQFEAEIVMIDFWGIAFPPGALVDFLSKLRRFRPNTRIVIYHLDPWMPNSWNITRALAPQVDLIWSHFPRIPLWDEPSFHNKLTFAPFPIGVDQLDHAADHGPDSTLFLGGVVHYNPTRAFWLSALIQAKAPFDMRITDHEDDGLSAANSYAKYLHQLGTAGRSLSFSVRENGYRLITGRTFESIWAGACLIQEQAQEVEDYFTPGQHYLSFKTFAELVALLNAVDRNPNLARKIAQAGHAFYQAHYNDQLLVAHIDHMLFGTTT